MRKSKLGIQALRPDDKALEFVKQYRPGVFKIVINNPGDFAGWMPQIPSGVFVIARYLGEGVDGWEWTPANARRLAAKHLEIHRVNYRRPDAWECINEPVAHSVEKMQQLAEFQRIWAEDVRKVGISPIVGNFSIGNPKVLSADGINLMRHFRPAMEVGDFFGYHGYGCPKTLSDWKWKALRYRELFVDAGMTMPVLLTECGVDCGSKGHGYKERWTDAEYAVQLEELDQVLQADPLVKKAAVFCYAHWNWPTFDLTRNCAALVGEYIVAEGDIEEEDMGTKIKVKTNGAIQTMDLEEYVRGVVPREAIASWGDLPNGMAVLEAQAVAARTYAAYAIFHPRHGAAAVCTTAHCQVWTKATDPRTDRAVLNTEAAFVTQDGEIIQTEYVSRCGMPQCPLCQGQNGHDGKQWPGRMCQWGARYMAVEQGKTWREILQFYYPDADWEPSPGPGPEPPEGDIAEWLLEELDQHLPPWQRGRAGYNPRTGLARAARLAEPPLGLPLTEELRKTRGSTVIVHQFFWRGAVWCPETDYKDIHIVRY